MKQSKLILTALIALSGIPTALADAGGPIRLRATDGTGINITYGIKSFPWTGGYGLKCGDFAGFEIELRNPAFTPDQHVRVVVLSYDTHSDYRTPFEVRTYDAMNRNRLDGRNGGDPHIFVAQTSDYDVLVGRPTACGASLELTQELAVVVDERWLKDPISGNSNFKFSLAK